MLKKGDIALAIIAVVLALIIWVLFAQTDRESTDGLVAVIKKGNTVIERIVLGTMEDAREILIEGEFHQIILVENGRIRFQESGCPKKICVQTGWLEEAGDMAVCLPNKTMITVERLKGGNIDGVAY